MRTDWIAHPWHYPLDEYSSTSAWHDAGVVAYRSTAAEVMVPGGVLIVTAEDSGVTTPKQAAYAGGRDGTWQYMSEDV